MEEVFETGAGGVDEDPPRVVDPPRSTALNNEYLAAKDEVLRARAGITAANLEAIRKKLEEANKAMKDFSHGNLTKQIEEQHKNLKAELLAVANMEATTRQEQQNKAAFENAVQVYLNKRLELAKIRLQEIAQEDKQTTDARNRICSTFRTPTGVTGTGEVIAKLGTDFSHIERSEGTIFKSSVQVKCENGVMSSSSPPDLALAVKARGWNSFKFTQCKVSKRGVDILIGSVEEMLKVGIKDVRIDDKLMEKINAKPHPTGHSSGDYAAELARFLKPSTRNVTSSQKKRLEQLKRICDASRGAYIQQTGNPVYDNDGNLKTGKDVIPKPIQHQVDAFMRLTSDEDRREYLEILFPMSVGHHASDFVDELNKRGMRFVGSRGTTTVLPRDLSPEDYFRQKMLGPNYKTDFLARRSDFDEERNRQKKLEHFNLDSTRLDDRKKSYLDSNDETLLRRYARSDKLNGPGNTNDTRINLVKDVFRAVQATAPPAAPNPRAISLYNRNLSSVYTVREDDQKAFLLKALALFENIKVKNAAGDTTDFQATARVKTILIRELRQESQAIFVAEKRDGNPKAYENFYKNKILIDELEQRMLVKHFDEQKIEARIPPEQHELRFNRLIDRHLNEFNDLNQDQRAMAFVFALSPELQLRVWNKMDPNDAQTAEFRAQVLHHYIQFYEENPTPAGLHFLNSAIGPLMKNMSRDLTKEELIRKADQLARDGTIAPKVAAEWTPAELQPIQESWRTQQRNGLTAMTAMTTQLHEICQDENINGTKHPQNRALACIRDNIAEANSNFESTTAQLDSPQLFKEYFNKLPGPSAPKLLEMLKCYAQVREELSGPRRWLLDRRFRNDMQELIFPQNRDNALMDGIIVDLYLNRNDYCPNPDGKPTRHFIKELNAMLNSRGPTHAPSGEETEVRTLLSSSEGNEGFEPFDNL